VGDISSSVLDGYDDHNFIYDFKRLHVLIMLLTKERCGVQEASLFYWNFHV